jgi:hypothetical protein
MTATIHRDVVYSRPPGYRPLSLDLYVPAGPARALCLYLHGGGRAHRYLGPGPGPGDQDGPPLEPARETGLGVLLSDMRTPPLWRIHTGGSAGNRWV